MLILNVAGLEKKCGTTELASHSNLLPFSGVHAAIRTRISVDTSSYDCQRIQRFRFPFPGFHLQLHSPSHLFKANTIAHSSLLHSI